MTLNPGIGRIQESSRRLLEGFDAKPGVEQGIRIAAAELYAGKCHFIYELLQNAGDVGATRVEFTLAEDSLEFRHRGGRCFTIEDVDSITNYHASSKKGEDYETVGKFGMGFKSVYEYTETPEIHSGDYHFRIVRMFYPETNGVRSDEKLGEWTKFVFPFKYEGETCESIFKKIKQGLLDIRPQTLLFLKTINEIECLFEDGSYLRITRESKEHLVRIKRVDATITSSFYYLKFSDQVQMPVTAKKIGLDMAYGLRVNGDVRDDSSIDSLTLNQFLIEPVAGGVFVSFPAELERSNLQFHINASFATPMSRESLCDTTDNDYLLGCLAKLTVDTLPYLRDNGLLTIDAMGVFPIDTDQISGKYCAFSKAIIEAFGTQDLFPTTTGKHRRTDALMLPKNEIAEFLTENEVSVICPQYKVPLWAKAPSPPNSRASNFVSLLKIKSFGDAELKGLSTYSFGQVVGQDEATGRLQSVLSGFDNKRLCEFYRRISKSASIFASHDKFRAVFMTKARTFKHAHDLYFDCEGAPTGRGEDFLLKVYDDSDEKIVSFLRRAGVRDYSFAEILDRERGAITCDSVASDESIAQHLSFVELFVQAVERDGANPGRFADFLWLCRTNRGDLAFRKASEIVMDLPYEETGASRLLKAYPSKSLISPCYKEHFSDGQLQTLKRIFGKFEFVRDVQVVYIKSDSLPWSHPRYHELRPPYGARARDPSYCDCDVYNIGDLLKLLDDDISCRLWRLLTSLKKGRYSDDPFTAVYAHNGSHVNPADSLLVCHLMDGAWVKNTAGEWKCPRDVSFEDLHSMYEPRETCAGLQAVKFGTQVELDRRLTDEKRRVVKEFAEQFGVESVEELSQAADLIRQAKECGIDIRAQIEERKRLAAMPESTPGSISRRRERTTEDWHAAPAQTREVRERRVRTGPNMSIDARAQLLQYYLDDNRKMRCQMCRNAMPFDKRDGKPYFECVQVFNGMQRECPDQYLALCPECQAEYDEWVRKYDSNAQMLRQSIIDHVVNESAGSVVITLPGLGSVECPLSPLKGKSLYFLQPHFISLQAVVKAELEEMEQEVE